MRRVAAGINTSRYMSNGGRFIHDRYRCGTEGDTNGLGSAVFECQRGIRDTSFIVDD